MIALIFMIVAYSVLAFVAFYKGDTEATMHLSQILVVVVVGFIVLREQRK